jgi:hypothetical protein
VNLFFSAVFQAQMCCIRYKGDVLFYSLCYWVLKKSCKSDSVFSFPRSFTLPLENKRNTADTVRAGAGVLAHCGWEVLALGFVCSFVKQTIHIVCAYGVQKPIRVFICYMGVVYGLRVSQDLN